MRFIDMSDYNRGVRVYWWTTTLIGAGAVAFAVADVARLDRGNLLAVTTLMALVFLVGLRPTRVPSTQAAVTPADIFIFLTAIAFGAAAATLVAVTDAFCASCRRSQRWTSRLGGPALMAIAVYISASVFERGLHWLRETALLGNESATLLSALLLFSLLYFLLNSLLVAIHQALKGRVSLMQVWWTNYLWTGLTCAASASAAGLIYLAIFQFGVASLLAAVPLVAVIFATSHLYSKRADDRAKASERISRLHLATVEALATAIDAKDEITHDHVYRVRVYACGLARYFGLSDAEIEALSAGALLHDVGKIAVPDHILNKPGKLTAAEFEKMKIHTVVGAQIMERVNFPYPVVPIVRHHHERWDGAGYPDGLSGEQIPLTARILTVVDCFDAVREDRNYRKGMDREKSCRWLMDNAGSQFDPRVVEAFLANLPIYEAEIAAHKADLLPLLTPTIQPGLSEKAHFAVPAAGLAPAEPPDYVKQIHAAHTEVAALYEMAQTFSASLDVRDVVTLTVNRIEGMIPFTTCVFYLRDKVDDSSAAAHVFGQNADLIRGRSIAAGHGITGWVIINGRPMTNTDPMLDLSNYLSGNETGYRTAAVYPLKDDRETIGALALYSSELASYGNEHLHLIESVSRLASTALQHALLYEQTKASAQTDPLTGLPNGRALYARLDQELATATQQTTSFSVLCLNLVGLRAVNDTFGYRVGDRMLSEVAGCLQRVLGDSLMLSRVAGDEFICMVADGGRLSASELYDEARLQVERLRIEVRPDHFARVRLSFGMVRCPDDGQTVDEILHAAAVAAHQHSKGPDGAPMASPKSQMAQDQSPERTKTGSLALVQ
jgi:diguanylate cyclase (GGDEF)-like protein/putative nucleotidyltransferase with HDIG domain